MATWKRFTAAVDSSAQSFLKNKKFSREKRKFSWDWHAWNLVLVSTPSLILAIYLHRVEQRMHEEAKFREEIQERTGISSRGFLIPNRKVREEVQGILSAGNRRNEVKAEHATNHNRGKSGSDEKSGRPGDMLTEIQMLRRRLDSMEQEMKSPQPGASSGAKSGREPGDGGVPSSVGRPSPGQRGENAAESSEGLLAGNDKTLETAVDKAKAMATAAGGWVLREGQAQGQRLAKAGRDWIAGYKESGEDASQLEASVTAGNTEVDDQEVISGKDASQLETSVTAGNTEVDNREVISGKDASQLETSVTAGNTEVDDPEVIASGASKTRDTC
ncbi:unnamed protein product, partial [Ascophyllum nodosum]